MATSPDFVDYVCEQIETLGQATFKKMFGEYMVYLNGKPIFLVCYNTVYVKILKELTDILKENEKGLPYKGAKEHYILDVDDQPKLETVAKILELITPLPKSRKKS